MRKEFLPFSAPSISEDQIAAVADVLRSGWITTGPKSADFEAQFAAYTQSPGAVGVSSATGGMQVALRALDIGPGDEVITPSMTWVSTVNMIVLAGARPVFVDVDRDTLMTSAEHIAGEITERTKLIIPVHYAGAACDIDPICELGEKHGIPVLQDAAHAVGTEYRNSRTGKTGTAIFSFHPIKNITTGEGGMVTSDNPKLLDRIRRLKFHGLGKDAHDRKTQGRSPQAEVLEPGYKYNMTDIAAVLGLGQLERLDGFITRRSEIARLYHEKLAGIDELAPLETSQCTTRHAWHLFIVRILDKAGIGREDFMAALKQQNIGTGLHFLAVHTQKYYRKTAHENIDTVKNRKLPNTEWNSQRICSLPMFPAMTDDDVNDVVAGIKNVLAGA